MGVSELRAMPRLPADRGEVVRRATRIEVVMTLLAHAAQLDPVLHDRTPYLRCAAWALGATADDGVIARLRSGLDPAARAGIVAATYDAIVPPPPAPSGRGGTSRPEPPTVPVGERAGAGESADREAAAVCPLPVRLSRPSSLRARLFGGRR
jgi:hypothetical protein